MARSTANNGRSRTRDRIYPAHTALRRRLDDVRKRATGYYDERRLRIEYEAHLDTVVETKLPHGHRALRSAINAVHLALYSYHPQMCDAKKKYAKAIAHIARQERAAKRKKAAESRIKVGGTD